MIHSPFFLLKAFKWETLKTARILPVEDQTFEILQNQSGKKRCSRKKTETVKICTGGRTDFSLFGLSKKTERLRGNAGGA